MSQKIVLIFIFILSLGTSFVDLPFLALITSTLYFLVFGFLLGQKLFLNYPKYFQIIFGVLSLLGVYSLSYTLLFYLFDLPTLTYPLVTTVITLNLIFSLPKTKKPSWHFKKPQDEPLILNLIYYFFIIIAFYSLLTNGTIQAISSPWQVVTPGFWLSFLSALTLLIILNKKNYQTWQLINLSIFFFLVLNVGNLIYRLGFGFDPFIHQATEKLLLVSGTITPKPPFYIGHYVLVTHLTWLTHLPLELIDRFLPSIILSLSMPLAIFWGTKKYFNFSMTWALNASLLILVIPFYLLANPTPQALALGLNIIIIFLSLIYLQDKTISFGYLFFLALLTFAIHPLSGLPTIILLCFLWLNKYDNFISKLWIFLGLITTTIAYPIAFWLANFISTNKVSFKLNHLRFDFLNLFNSTRQFNFFLDLIYFNGQLIFPFLLLLAFTSSLIILKNKKHLNLLTFSIIGFSLLLNAIWLASFTNFQSLVDQEQLFFPTRIFFFSLYFFLPVIVFLGRYLKIKTIYQQTFLIILALIFISSSLYLSYPRNDNYQNSNFINLSIDDLKAVQKIEQEGEDYVVLAGQMTSAAAVKTLGFDRQILTNQGEKIYLYPLPTGGQLYRYYLQLLKSKNPQKIIQEVKEWTQTTQVFVVLNTYWSNFPALDQRLKKNAKNYFMPTSNIIIYEY